MKTEILLALENLVANEVPGAKELVLAVKNADGQEFQNLMTEAFAAYFILTELKFPITQIEGPKRVLSPHREKSKSCDIRCEDLEGNEIFFEVKDCSKDLIRGMKAGISGYTPSTGSEIRQWISNKVFEAIQKGANYLIVRIPVWHDAYEGPKLNDIDFEIFLTHESQSEIPVSLSIYIPTHFRGIYVIKPFGHRFYRPRKVQQDEVVKTEAAPSV